jgi:pimeloyl-ACP methyl ester carboxylesterase
MSGCTSSDQDAADPVQPNQDEVVIEPAEALAKFYEQGITFQPCGDSLSCATVVVPRDYENPEAGSFGVQIAKRPAGDPANRVGTLMVNPGGPGGSGIEYVRSADFLFSPEILDRFDIVGFDPRGVAESNPIVCFEPQEADEFLASDASPDDATETDELIELSRKIGELCGERAPELVAQIGSMDVARDMDVIRAVLGESKLDYLGKSYGTLLGALYMEMFPDRVGRFILDGALDPSLGTVEVSYQQAIGFEVALQRFVDDCITHEDCPLRSGGKEGKLEVQRLLDEIDTRPLNTDDPDRPLTQSLALLALASLLYDDREGWPILRWVLGDALLGDGATFLEVADFYVERNPDGTYATNSTDALYAVNCFDGEQAPGLAEVQKLAKEWKKEAPVFGEYLAWGILPCNTWPAYAKTPVGKVTGKGAPPALVIGTLYDPATSYQQAVGLADQLESGVLVSWEADGHTAYGRGSKCIDDLVDAFLTRGVVPQDGIVCK